MYVFLWKSFSYISVINEKKKLDAELTKKIHYIRSRCDGITWFVVYKLIQRNVKKAEKKIVEAHRKKLCDLTRNRSLPYEAEDIITNLSDYCLNTEETDLLKDGLNFSIPPKLIIKNRCVLPIWHDRKIHD